MGYRLAELAERHALQLVGDGGIEIRGVCTLDPGEPDRLGFLSNPLYRGFLATTRAAAVVLAADAVREFSGNALVAKDPYLAFARIAKLFDDECAPAAGVHATAVVDGKAQISDQASVGPHAVIGAGAQVNAGAVVGPGCVIEPDVRIGVNSRLEARVYVARRCVIGARCRLHPGVVIGARGFGLARGPEGWEDVPQLGGVVIGDDVEIGANTAVDRGAIGNTVISSGVKLDNQVQIGHNVQIGEHTVVAACTGISGSTRIGARCIIGGGVGMGGHLEIGDDVVIQGWTMVTKSLQGPGQYGSGWPVETAREWRRQVGRLRRLERLDQRVSELEQSAREPASPRGGKRERDT